MSVLLRQRMEATPSLSFDASAIFVMQKHILYVCENIFNVETLTVRIVNGSCVIRCG